MDLAPSLPRLYWLAARHTLVAAVHTARAALVAMCPCGGC